MGVVRQPPRLAPPMSIALGAVNCASTKSASSETKSPFVRKTTIAKAMNFADTGSVISNRIWNSKSAILAIGALSKSTATIRETLKSNAVTRKLSKRTTARRWAVAPSTSKPPIEPINPSAMPFAAAKKNASANAKNRASRHINASTCSICISHIL